MHDKSSPSIPTSTRAPSLFAKPARNSQSTISPLKPILFPSPSQPPLLEDPKHVPQAHPSPHTSSLSSQAHSPTSPQNNSLFPHRPNNKFPSAPTSPSFSQHPNQIHELTQAHISNISIPFNRILSPTPNISTLNLQIQSHSAPTSPNRTTQHQSHHTAPPSPHHASKHYTFVTQNRTGQKLFTRSSPLASFRPSLSHAIPTIPSSSYLSQTAEHLLPLRPLFPSSRPSSPSQHLHLPSPKPISALHSSPSSFSSPHLDLLFGGVEDVGDSEDVLLADSSGTVHPRPLAIQKPPTSCSDASSRGRNPDREKGKKSAQKRAKSILPPAKPLRLLLEPKGPKRPLKGGPKVSKSSSSSSR